MTTPTGVDALATALLAHPAAPMLLARPGPLADAIAGQAPERLRVAARGSVRLALAAGVASAGRATVVELDGHPPRGVPTGPGLVGLTADADVASAAWGAGWTVLQTAWPSDAATLLSLALAHPGPAVLRVADAARHGADSTGGAPGVPFEGTLSARRLRDGDAGVLVASGPRGVPLALEVAALLDARGVALAVVELPALRAGGPDPSWSPLVTDEALFVGASPAAADAWGGLRPVPVPDEPHAAMRAVADQLPARRSAGAPR